MVRDKKIKCQLLWPTAEMLQSCCTEAAEGGNVDNGFAIECLAKPRETKKASCEAPLSVFIGWGLVPVSITPFFFLKRVVERWPLREAVA